MTIFKNSSTPHRTSCVPQGSSLTLSSGNLSAEVGMERDLTHDERVDVAYRVFRAMCAQYPDRLITLVDAQGRTLARSDWTRLRTSSRVRSAARE